MPMPKACTYGMGPTPLTEFSYCLGVFHISIAISDGAIRSSGHDLITDPRSRDAVTAWAIHVLILCGHTPACPLAICESIWGSGRPRVAHPPRLRPTALCVRPF